MNSSRHQFRPLSINTAPVTFKYDPFGRRIYKSFSAGTTSVYAYDGDNLIEETNSTGRVVARYSQTQNIDEPLAMLRSGATSYYHADGLGSVTSLSSSAGAIANTYTYDSYGNLTASTGSLTNSFRYTGREFDSETGLYYYRARYYDQSAGRFISEDPTGIDGGQNFYAYVRNNPIYFVDPRGLQATTGGSAKPNTASCTGQGNAGIQRLIQSAHKSFEDCVHEGLGPVSTLKDIGKDLLKDASGAFGHDRKEKIDPQKIMDEARSASIARINSILADCLRKNPLAALFPGYGGPPAGDVFEGIPPYDLDPALPKYP